MNCRIAVVGVDALDPRVVADFWAADAEGNELCVLSRSVQDVAGAG